MANIKRLMVDADFNEYAKMVEQIPDGGTLVEIGVYLGGSLASLAPIIKRKNILVIAIDVFDAADYNEPEVMKDKENMRARFEANMKSFGLDPVIIDRNKNVAVPTMADMVFIDGDHSYAWCKRDIKLAKAILAEGGIIAGHDYDSIHPGVQKAVDEEFPNLVLPGGCVWRGQ